MKLKHRDKIVCDYCFYINKDSKLMAANIPTKILKILGTKIELSMNLGPINFKIFIFDLTYRRICKHVSCQLLKQGVEGICKK